MLIHTKLIICHCMLIHRVGSEGRRETSDKQGVQEKTLERGGRKEGSWAADVKLCRACPLELTRFICSSYWLKPGCDLLG